MSIHSKCTTLYIHTYMYMYVATYVSEYACLQNYLPIIRKKKTNIPIDIITSPGTMNDQPLCKNTCTCNI